jgi:hypothetical protein
MRVKVMTWKWIAAVSLHTRSRPVKNAHPARIQVDLLPIRYTSKNFRCGITRASNNGLEHLVRSVDDFGNTKVNQHKRGIGLLGKEKEVLWFEITVNN